MLRRIGLLILAMCAVLGFAPTAAMAEEPPAPPQFNVDIYYGPIYPTGQVGSETTIFDENGNCAQSQDDGKLIKVIINNQPYLELSLPQDKHEKVVDGSANYQTKNGKVYGGYNHWNGKSLLPIRMTTTMNGKTYHMKLYSAFVSVEEPNLVLDHGGPCGK
ncbi:MAG TPA: hypothetical protein VG992_01130 [Candidatus Saccharimonadales bacterium]|nr:hypothetical protein [Candidatus Saccharimonadales bacterium]